MAEANQWMEYIDQVLNKLNYETNEWTVRGACDAAAIYGLDGSAWAWSPNFPELKSYDFPLEDMGGNVTNIAVDEIQCAIKASEGNRNPCDAGIRLGNEKYMFVAHDPETQVVQLSKRGGGAAICKTATAVIIAFYVKDKAMETGGFQTIGMVAEQVSAMGAFLREQGY